MRSAASGCRQTRDEGLRIAIFSTVRRYRSLPSRPSVIQVNLLGNEPGGSGISRGTATTSAQREWAQIAVSRSRLNLAIPPQLPNASGTSANTRNDRAAEQAVGLCAHFMEKQKLGKQRAEKGLQDYWTARSKADVKCHQKFRV